MASTQEGTAFHVDEDEADFMVHRYTCHDSNTRTSIGANCLEMKWNITLGSTQQTVDLDLHIDRSIPSAPEVSVICGGTQVHPPTSDSKQPSRGARLTQDLKWELPFLGAIKGLYQQGYFELRPAQVNQERWLKATLNNQREDGLHDVEALVPDGDRGYRHILFSGVPMTNLRDARAKRPIALPQRSLLFRVPAVDPLHPSLVVDEHIAMTHFFARPTPPLALHYGGSSSSGNAKSEERTKKQEGDERNDGFSGLPVDHIVLQVSKDWQEVCANVGHSTLEHFLADEVRAVSSNSSKCRHEWVFQVGPFASHTVVFDKARSKSGLFCILTVDGDVLVECASEDTGSPHESGSRVWSCRFHLIGKRLIEWEVFETSATGQPLASQGSVFQTARVSLVCIVTCEQERMDKATLSVDGQNFAELPKAAPAVAAEERTVKLHPSEFRKRYAWRARQGLPLAVPQRVNDSNSEGLCNLFRCCGSNRMTPDDFLSMPIELTRPRNSQALDTQGPDGLAADASGDDMPQTPLKLNDQDRPRARGQNAPGSMEQPRSGEETSWCRQELPEKSGHDPTQSMRTRTSMEYGGARAPTQGSAEKADITDEGPAPRRTKKGRCEIQ